MPLSCIFQFISSFSDFGWEMAKEIFLNLARMIVYLWPMLGSVEAVYTFEVFSGSLCVSMLYF